MDPLSVAAGIIAVLQKCSKVIKGCDKYDNDVWHVVRDRNKIVEEITSLRSILFSLKKHADSEDTSKSQSSLYYLDDPDGALIMCKAELAALESKLDPKQGWKAALFWPLKEAEVNKTLDRINRFKTTLNVALSVHQT